MSPAVPPEEVAPYVQELNDLVAQGKERGIWASKASCARTIGLAERAFRGMTLGERTGKKYVRDIVRRVRDIVEGRVKPITSEKSKATETQTDFDRYYELGIQQGKWMSMSECSKVLSLNRRTVRMFRDTSLDAIPVTRTRNLHSAAMGKMRKIFTEEKINKENERRREASHPAVLSTPTVRASAGQTDLAMLIAQPTIERIDALDATLKAQFATLLQAVPARPQQNVDLPHGVAPSSWVDDVVAGRLEFKDQKLPNVRFILTKETIRTLLTKFRKEEISDTNGLAEVIADATAELRRRLTLIPQQKESDDHADAIRELVPHLSRVIRELVALAITVEEVRECEVEKGLIRAARHFDSLSDFFHSPLDV